MGAGVRVNMWAHINRADQPRLNLGQKLHDVGPICAAICAPTPPPTPSPSSQKHSQQLQARLVSVLEEAYISIHHGHSSLHLLN